VSVQSVTLYTTDQCASIATHEILSGDELHVQGTGRHQ
jgi:hypothetical protein